MTKLLLTTILTCQLVERVSLTPDASVLEPKHLFCQWCHECIHTLYSLWFSFLN